MEENDFEYIIDLNRLQLGDIILASYDRGTSEMMEKATGCPYHHAMIVVADCSIIHSFEEGVHSANPMRDVFERAEDLVVLRLKDRVDFNLLVGAVNFVRRKVGTSYSKMERGRVLRPGMGESVAPNRQYCSRLVAQAYREFGIDLVNNADYCSLRELLESNKVEVIRDILYKGNDEQLEYARGSSEIEEKQNNATNMLLLEARNLTDADMQTLEQLEKFVSENPEFDERITKIVEASGYLELYQIDMKNNPEHYDFRVLRDKVAMIHWHELASAVLETADRFIAGAKAERARLQARYEQQPLAYYKVFIQLSTDLVSVYSRSKNAMLTALSNLTW